MLCNKITVYFYILNFLKGKLLYFIFIMQYDNIYEIKDNKKDNNLKTQNLFTSTQSRVPNNTKFIKLKQRCKKKNPPKMKKKM